jgi:hypothetical protein
MAVPKITLYIDIVSPFAYIAFHILKVGACCEPVLENVSNRYSELAYFCQMQCELYAYFPRWLDECVQ